ncbi:MAG: carbohydrate binding domain-containing protein, partial [Armatimonadota bacterium]
MRKTLYAILLIAAILIIICTTSFADLLNLPKVLPGNNYSEGVYNLDGWRYFSVGGAKGSIESVDSAVKGRISIKLSRMSASGDSGIDRLGNLIPVKRGRRYTATIWARSNAGCSMHLTLSTHRSNGDWLQVQTEKRFGLDPKSRPYRISYMAPPDAAQLSLGIRINGTGSIIIDKCSIEEDKLAMKIT